MGRVRAHDLYGIESRIPRNNTDRGHLVGLLVVESPGDPDYLEPLWELVGRDQRDDRVGDPARCGGLLTFGSDQVELGGEW